MNLMLNGIEAMKDMGTGGELTIKSQQDDNRQVLISVGDTGVGLEPDQAAQIFNAFFSTKPQGTGMEYSSVGPLSNRMAAPCGSAQTLAGVQRFSSPYPVKSA